MANKLRVAEAVTYLIAAENYARLLTDIRHIVATWDTYPMAYDGKLSVLNAMIDVGLENPVAFDRLVTFIESKRREVPATKKLDYQRTLMAERRRRENKALALRALQIGPMKPAVRNAYVKEVRERWMEARDRKIEEARTTAGDAFDGAARLAVIRDFWEHIDQTLDANIAAEEAKKRVKK